jgi:hypothetical protein
MRRSIAALCLIAAAFPGNASEIVGADAGSFKAFDTTYAKDKSNAYFDGHLISGADATSFGVLDRSGFAKDRNHVYQLDRPVSDDPAHFELLDGGLSKDTTSVYWTDGRVLSDDPAHFAIVSNNDHYLFTKDGRAVQVNGKPIADADPATFRVLNAAFECSADAGRAYYRNSVIAGADPRTFARGRPVTGCTETSISFAE